MDWQSYIHTDSNILAGKPVIKGTRVSVDYLLGRLADGWSEKQILDNHPSLKQIHLQAVYAFFNQSI